jgi:uncharacterized membrane protein
MNGKLSIKRIILLLSSSAAIGAALGLLFGMMLLNNLAIGGGIGAICGLVAGVIIDKQNSRNG